MAKRTRIPIENEVQIERTYQRKRGILRRDSFLKRLDTNSLDDDESYINAVIADITEDDSPPPRRRLSKFRRAFLTGDQKSHVETNDVRKSAALTRWQMVKNKLIKAATGIDNFRRKSTDVIGLHMNIKSQEKPLNVKKENSSLEEYVKKVETGAKKNHFDVKFLPFCEEYDGFSSRKTKTISESIQAILEQRESEKNAKLRNLVEECVTEMLAPLDSRSYSETLSNDSKYYLGIDEMEGEFFELYPEYDLDHRHSIPLGIIVNGTESLDDPINEDGITSNFELDSIKQSESGMLMQPINEDSALKRFVEMHVGNFFRSYNKRFDLDFIRSKNLDKPIDKVKGNDYSMISPFAVNNDSGCGDANDREADLSKLFADASFNPPTARMNQSKRNGTMPGETSYLKRLERRYLCMKQHVHCRHFRIDKKCSMDLTIHYVPNEEKLYVNIDRIESLLDLPNTAKNNETFIKACIMPRISMKQKRTKNVIGEDTTLFQETLGFDMLSTNMKSGSIRFQVYQKKSSFFRSKIICVGQSLVWLDECYDLCEKSRIVAKIFPY